MPLNKKDNPLVALLIGILLYSVRKWIESYRASYGTHAENNSSCNHKYTPAKPTQSIKKKEGEITRR